MSELQYAKSFRDLVVYQKSRQLSKEILKLTKSFPKEEMFSLTDQIRRSSRSIGANLAEAWAKRRYEKHFLRSCYALSKDMSNSFDESL
ncbi:MAG: four helix bundle protein [Chloroflexi bacterium]|nr:four helix bundle protein [Chloroflexota bacterium]